MSAELILAPAVSEAVKGVASYFKGSLQEAAFKRHAEKIQKLVDEIHPGLNERQQEMVAVEYAKLTIENNFQSIPYIYWAARYCSDNGLEDFHYRELCRKIKKYSETTRYLLVYLGQQDTRKVLFSWEKEHVKGSEFDDREYERVLSLPLEKSRLDNQSWAKFLSEKTTLHKQGLLTSFDELRSDYLIALDQEVDPQKGGVVRFMSNGRMGFELEAVELSKQMAECHEVLARYDVA